MRKKNCLNKADFARKMQDSQEKGDKNEQSREKKGEKDQIRNPSSEFKIALAAMCSEEDYKTLEGQFFSGN